jgi:hypothetical protein
LAVCERDDVLFISGTRDLSTIAAVDWLTARLGGTLPDAPWTLVKAPRPATRQLGWLRRATRAAARAETDRRSHDHQMSSVGAVR